MMPMRIMIVLAGMLAVGCSDGPDRPTIAGSDHPTTTDLGRPAAADHNDKGVLITKTEYGEDWPYTVDSGLLYCDPPGSNVVLEADGKVYALNGRAMGNATERGYLNAHNTITLKDENGYFTIGDVGKIISRGLSMCD